MDKSNERRASKEGKNGGGFSSTGSDKLLEKHLETLTLLHSEISEVELQRYKRKWNQNLTNAIQGLGAVTGEMSTYLSNRKKAGIYGTEETEE